MKKILKLIAIIFILLSAVIVSFLVFATVTDYEPEAIVELEIKSNTTLLPNEDQTFSIFTWNIGYGALGSTEDFFLDGGTKGRPDSKEDVEKYMNNILDSLEDMSSDFSMIQEIDVKAKRSYYLDELNLISKLYEDYGYSFAKNFDVNFVPVPWPPLGEVEAGLATYSKYEILESKRHKFESNYSWPKKTIMLDRCFVVTEVSLPNRDGNLILINAHFSAYDDGTLRVAQLKAIKDFIIGEYEAGNYVVLGGDWNQTFEFLDTSSYPLYKNGDFYLPSIIPNDWIDEGWTYGIADNVPTYRLLDAPYEEGVTQVGVIDGFLVSPNISIEEVEVLDFGFKDSDHNPVIMKFNLK